MSEKMKLAYSFSKEEPFCHAINVFSSRKGMKEFQSDGLGRKPLAEGELPISKKSFDVMESVLKLADSIGDGSEMQGLFDELASEAFKAGLTYAKKHDKKRKR